MGISDVIQLLCGVALFLFGMNLMGSGLKKVAGKKLEVFLYKLTSNPFKGILLGTGVTAAIQSSSATSVMVVGFVNSGMMKVKQAIGIIMGAIIGTSVTGWIICLSSVNGSGIFEVISTDTLTAILAIVGIILLMFTKKESNHHISFILLGFAVLMVGITLMTDSVYPLRESQTFIDLLTSFSNPVLGVVIGMLFTCVIQSASAAVGILQTLAVTGAISFNLALPIIMGIAIGASLPVLLSALGANTSGKRTALIYLLVDFFGAVIFGIIFYSLNAIFKFSFADSTMTMFSIALLNTVFRVIIVILLSPFMSLLEKLVMFIVPEKKNTKNELLVTERLEERFVNHPALAIEQTKIAMNSMAEYSCESVFEALKLFESYTDGGFDRVLELEDIVDAFEDKIGTYIVKVMKNEMDEDQNKTLNLYLHAINDFERIGDHAKNLAEAAQEKREKNIKFSDTATKEIETMFKVITEILSATKNSFIEDNTQSAYRIAPLEEIVDNLCDEYKIHHIARVQNETCDYDHGFVFNDMLTDMERIGDHCSNLGVAIRIKHSEMSDKHGALSKYEIENSHDFAKYYKEYLEQFSINI